MKFIPIDLGGSLYSRNNLINIVTNIFKIKFFYDEDNLEAISLLKIEEIQEETLKNYLRYSHEAMICINILNAFVYGDATQEKNAEDLEFVLDFFKLHNILLDDEDIIHYQRFKEWLSNNEYF